MMSYRAKTESGTHHVWVSSSASHQHNVMYPRRSELGELQERDGNTVLLLAHDSQRQRITKQKKTAPTVQ